MPGETQTTELVFKTDAEKAAAIEALQDKVESDPDNPALMDEFTRVSNAKIGEESSAGEQTTEEQPAQEPEPDQTQTEEPAQEVQETTQQQTESWFPKDFIPKDTVVGEDGQEKPLWTFDDPKTGPERLAKSYVNSQKYIRKLERQVPGAYNEGYEKAKAEYEAKLKEAQEKLKQTPAPTQQVESFATTQPQAPQGVDDTALKQARAALDKAADTNSDDYDVTTHTQAIQVYNDAAREYDKKVYDARIAELSTKSEKQLEEQRKAQEEADKRKAEEDKQKAAQEASNKAWNEAVIGIDSFASEPDNKQYASGRSFSALNKEANDFHTKLAQQIGNKYSVTQDDVVNAEIMYRRQDPIAVKVMGESGLQAPADYQKWD